MALKGNILRLLAVAALTVGVAGSAGTAHADTLGKRTSETPNSNTGSATAKSDANVEIQTGFLSLEAVPDFGFGTTDPGTTVALKNNTGVKDDDGNSDGTLQVNDYRDGDTNGTYGFKLTAQLGEFASYQNEATANPGTAANWKLALPALTSTGSATDGKTDVATLISNGAEQAIMTAAAGHSKGTNVFAYTASTPVKLSVPDDVTAGHYAADITWTLQAGNPTN